MGETMSRCIGIQNLVDLAIVLYCVFEGKIRSESVCCPGIPRLGKEGGCVDE